MSNYYRTRIAELERENERFRNVLIFLETAIMPGERNYDRYGYCQMHKTILEDFDRRVKQALHG